MLILGEWIQMLQLLLVLLKINSKSFPNTKVLEVFVYFLFCKLIKVFFFLILQCDLILASIVQSIKRSWPSLWSSPRPLTSMA